MPDKHKGSAQGYDEQAVADDVSRFIAGHVSQSTNDKVSWSPL
jgi:hypothetical protein